MNRLLLSVLALTAAVVLFTVRPARAGTATANLSVSATVLGICTIDAATLPFGNYDPSAPLATNVANDQGTITVHCTQGTDYWIALGNGSHFSGGRRMANLGATEFLPYALFHDAGHTVAWTNVDDVAHSSAFKAVAGYSDYTATVYGQIPVGQTVSTGAYTDSVVMTINF